MGNKHRRKTPQFYYNQQKQSAKRRKNQDGSIGIPWEFKHWEEWYAVWEESGKWELRGCEAGQYCMRRKDDIGPYSPDNVFIGSVIENNRDGMKMWRAKQREEKLQEEKTQVEKPVVVCKKIDRILPVKDFIAQQSTFEEIFTNQKTNPWSWRRVMRAAFPTLTRVLKV
jgi:hypothetical protein